MSRLAIKGVLLFGIAIGDSVHKDFELQLITVRGEMAASAILATEYPDFDELDGVSQVIIKRAAYLSQMLVKVGDLDEITLDMILNLNPDDFEILSDSEMILRKKLLGSSLPPDQTPQLQQIETG